MVLTEKIKRRLRYVLATALIIGITPLSQSERILSGAHSEDALLGKNLTCVIDLGDEIYGSHGLETGLNYELLNRFAQDNRCSVSIIASRKGENYIDSLRQGKVDIVITHADDLASAEGIKLSRRLNPCSAWAMQEDADHELMQINRWISHMASSKAYSEIEDRYSSVCNPLRRAEKGIRSKTISPYDSLIKEYAAKLGWDWRMLAAVVYQESRFSINSRSFRGAQGLMQVMPGTAGYYGIDDLLDPENNLKAGTSHLMRLQRICSKWGLEHDELIKFTLASYNAGEGRIADCRSFAIARQADCTKWEEIVKLIPLMREDSILEEESVKLGKFQGHETIAYIDNIMALYDAICRICPEA